MKILVIAPHPDDEVLGCGGTIAKHVDQEDEVYLCVVTKAYTPDWSKEFLENRPKEIEKADKILGIKKTYFLVKPSRQLFCGQIKGKEFFQSLALNLPILHHLYNI